VNSKNQLQDKSEAIVTREPEVPPELLTLVMDVALAKRRLGELQAFVRDYMIEGEDYGVIPGTSKPTLYKSGAEKLCEIYGLADDYIFLNSHEDFSSGLFDYTVKCILTRADRRVKTGLGSCNSYEGKYRWREAQRVCPVCNQPAIIAGKPEYGGGWICWRKKSGCGTQFQIDDKRITGQEAGRVQNEDIADVKNTILKMAKKRALIDATLAATRSSGLFTQDMEDLPAPPVDTTAKPPIKPPARSSAKPAPATQTADPARQAGRQDVLDEEPPPYDPETGEGFDPEPEPPRAPVPAPAARSQYANSKQMGKFWVEVKKANWQRDKVDAMLKRHQISDVKQIPYGKFTEVLKEVMAGAPRA
jgi:hypothetical protein